MRVTNVCQTIGFLFEKYNKPDKTYLHRQIPTFCIRTFQFSSPAKPFISSYVTKRTRYNLF